MFKKNHKEAMLIAAAGFVGSLATSFIWDHKLRNLKRDHKIELAEEQWKWHHNGWVGGREFGHCTCPIEHYTWCNSHPKMIEAFKKSD